MLCVAAQRAFFLGLPSLVPTCSITKVLTSRHGQCFGTLLVNGVEDSVSSYSDLVGFVPQVCSGFYFAFRFSLSFAKTQLKTRPLDMRLSRPFESFGRSPGTQRQAISVSSLLISLLSLSRYHDIFPYFLLLP